jgi:hypothetical protein
MKLSNRSLRRRFENYSPCAKPVIAFQRDNDIAVAADRMYRANDQDGILRTAVHGSRRITGSSEARIQLGADVRFGDDGHNHHINDERKA